ncbi:uncharacterized protein [Miscanthus floridulus]|uniref:uncharacterized protein n=1 Tax=Miscanthus floridulus TaxID=154761 RepID=UPI0034584260
MAPTQSENNNPSAEYKLKKYLLLLATLVVSVTYVAGLNLPGGVWQDDDTKDGHRAGDLILLDTHHSRYLTFYYCNATAFAASVVVCLLLLILQEGNNGVCETVLRVVMVLDLLGLMGAYAAGSCRDAFTTIYSTLVMSVVLAYAVLTFSLYIISKREKCKDDKQQQKEDHEKVKDKVASSEVLMLLATFVVTITYGGGLSPPGGFWSNIQDGLRVSLPILQDHSSARYQAFFVCNTTAFVASLLIIMLLLDKRLKKELSVRSVALYGLIVVALFGLVGAYAAGSCREIDTTIYVVSLIGAVLAYIFLQVAITRAAQRCRQPSTREINWSPRTPNAPHGPPGSSR